MKRLIGIFLSIFALNSFADERYAHEYSSDNNGNWQKHRTVETYQQQPPIQIYLSPNSQQFYSEDKETRDDRRWRQRREDLQRQPQTPYYENQFDRDDTHW
jgi:hypothetical protein